MCSLRSAFRNAFVCRTCPITVQSTNSPAQSTASMKKRWQFFLQKSLAGKWKGLYHEDLWRHVVKATRSRKPQDWAPYFRPNTLVLEHGMWEPCIQDEKDGPSSNWNDPVQACTAEDQWEKMDTHRTKKNPYRRATTLLWSWSKKTMSPAPKG